MKEIERARVRLESDAKMFKEAWVVAVAWRGASAQIASGQLRAHDFTVPDLSGLTKKQLAGYVEAVESDFSDVARSIVSLKSAHEVRQLAAFLQPLIEQAVRPSAPYKVCLAIEFERKFGPLLYRRFMEVPPYAELLMQGLHGLAVRHPEYMLARDLQFLYGLFMQAERIADSAEELANPQTSASENAQALARATVQTAFNLLESFISGLARTHLMTSQNLSESVRTRLEDNQKPLKYRVLAIPELITGRPTDLDANRPPLSVLFGEIKQRRDSFVHCEPGEQPDKRGYVKEQRFHEVAAPVVEQAVDLTAAVIRVIWTHVTEGQQAPRWLPKFGTENVHSRRDLLLTASNAAAQRH